jgi:hypothetical protein
MYKKIAAMGLGAALALSPLAAIAQTDQTTAPAAGTEAAPAQPMKAKSKPKHHHTTASKSKMKPAPAAAPAAPAEAPKS